MGSRLNHLWRLMATALCFSTFGLGGLVLTVVLFPLLHLFCRNRQTRQDIARKVIHHTFRIFTGMMQMLGVIRFDVAETGRYLTRQRGKVVIANHPTLIDVVVLISLMPNADCVTKDTLWRNIFMRGVMSAAGYIRNSGDTNEIIAACDRSLKAGYCLIIFPEGTRTEPGKPITLQRGAANIALRCSADMVSVLINCEPATLTKQDAWYSIPARRISFRMSPGRVFRVADYLSREQSLSVSARQLTEQIRAYFSENLKPYE